MSFLDDEGELAPEENTEVQETQDTTENKQEDNFQKVVPHQAMHEERQRRKQLEEEFNSYKLDAEERFKTFETLKEEIQNFRNERNRPDPDEDPLGSVNYKLTESEKQYNELKSNYNQVLEYLGSQEEQQKQYQEQQKVISGYQNAAQNYAQQNPDFVPAYNHLRQSLYNEYKAIGMAHQEIEKQINQDEYNIALRADQQGSNPAELIFKLAQTKGFGGGDLKTIEQGLKHATSPNVNSSTQEKTALETLADLPDDEFNKQWNQMFGESDLFG